MLDLGREGTEYYSIFRHLKTQLVASGIGSGGLSGTLIENYPHQDVIKTFAYPHEFANGTATVVKNIGMPVIAFEDASSNYSDIELGSTTNRLGISFVVTIFARTSQERLMLSNQIRHYVLEKAIPKFDFSNFEVPTSDGNYHVDRRTFKSFPIRTSRVSDEQDPNPYERHKQEIIFTVKDIS